MDEGVNYTAGLPVVRTSPAHGTAYDIAGKGMLEASLLTDSVIDQLLACKDEAQCLGLLSEKGWGNAETENDVEAILNCEEEKTWQVIQEVSPDLTVFDVMSYPKLYHNLKAAIKEVCTEVINEKIFYDDCEIPGKEMLSIVENKAFERLPGNTWRRLQKRLMRHCFRQEMGSYVM